MTSMNAHSMPCGLVWRIRAPLKTEIRAPLNFSQTSMPRLPLHTVEDIEELRNLEAVTRSVGH
jgi:hypothetical protein